MIDRKFELVEKEQDSIAGYNSVESMLVTKDTIITNYMYRNEKGENKLVVLLKNQKDIMRFEFYVCNQYIDPKESNKFRNVEIKI